MGVRTHITAGSFLFLALLIITLPIRWIAGACFAAVVHELSHITAIRLTGGEITAISLGVTGAKIHTLPMERGREVLCAVAGPLGSLALAYLLPNYPEAAICAMVQGLYNLLPVYPLDGGRMIRSFFPEPVCRGIEVFALLMVLGLGFWCAIQLNLGIFPLVPGCFLAFHTDIRKFPCKET